MSVGQRFKQYINFKRISVQKVSVSSDVTTSTIYNFINNNGSPKLSLIQAIGRAYKELNLNWLILGEGDMIQPIHSIDGVKDDEVGYYAKGVHDDLDFYPNLKAKVRELEERMKDKDTQQPDS